ncbi:hypothetical protein BDN70DRAFT_871569 [Pholiota conissans]|uniref:Glycosyltransferase n=1 Tax=Pholiota conissans TaxID=109636 RepID=A0A9P6D6Z3_9AGAR|nr:hypothetical protein BDN70DRAFT_871569 [Pholiota conissans]
MARRSLCLAYYCSGHGYGHATRVSAFARHLLSEDEGNRPIIYIVSSAPEHVFADSIACGARYRFAEIDPVIVQPLAYRVDRKKSVEVLKKFLDKKEELLERERKWLIEVQAHGVLSDAAFLGCLAARAAGLPSVLITNFSFDSVYSYLSTPLRDVAPPRHPALEEHPTAAILDMISDDPIPHAELAPLVEQIHAGYRCADLLIRLPGHIPLPSFFTAPPLPSYEWVHVDTRQLRVDILESLKMSPDELALLPSLPWTPSVRRPKKVLKRSVVQAPLLVRPPTAESSVYTPEGRARLLESIGVPPELHDPAKTKILIVSFGGQVFRRPGSSHGSSSRASSRPHSRNASQEDIGKLVNPHPHSPLDYFAPTIDSEAGIQPSRPPPKQSTSNFAAHILPTNLSLSDTDLASLPACKSRLATPNHIWIPGAPPASKPLFSPSLQPSTVIIPQINTIPPTPAAAATFEFDEYEDVPQLLPDASWIAVVCGVSKEQWNNSLRGDKDEELPEGFYVAPRDVYMPDLTAVGDVLLGKLGYGTVSECVDACTPFVYVSRPLFIEEHGLRLLLDQEGTGLELAREAYEAGDWAAAVSEAFAKGKKAKDVKRLDMARGVGVDRREEEGRKLAGTVTDWVTEWWTD